MNFLLSHIILEYLAHEAKGEANQHKHFITDIYLVPFCFFKEIKLLFNVLVNLYDFFGLPAPSENFMQVKKQELEPDTEKWIGWK